MRPKLLHRKSSDDLEQEGRVGRGDHEGRQGKEALERWLDPGQLEMQEVQMLHLAPTRMSTGSLSLPWPLLQPWRSRRPGRPNPQARFGA
mmetsp:Transcript_833/g.2005  ORF Transcript_833/g.2005 Transcript_833/m.2005 type:complete len:90 (-) Transcript_833:331-600(-)